MGVLLMNMHEYIETAASQIRAGQARNMVERELEAHIEDQAAYYREHGMSETEAEKEAVRQMGDPVEVGISMDRIHRPQTDWKMIVMLVFLCVLGLSLQIAYNREILGARLLEEGNAVSPGLFSGVSRILLFVLSVAVVLGVLVCVTDYTVILRHAAWFICLVLFVLWVEGVVIWRDYWLRLAFPHNWPYLLVPLYASLLYRYRGRGRRGFAGGIFLIALLQGIMGMPNGFLAATSFFGLRFSFVLLVMLSMAVMCGWYGESRRGKLLGLWGGAFLAFCMAVLWMLLSGGFRAERIRSILHPYDYADGAGYYVVTMRGWLGRCRLWGNPEAAAQFAQSFIGVSYDTPFSQSNDNILYLFLRYGIVPGIIVCLIFLGSIGYFLYRCLRQKNQLGRVTGMGCCLAFGAEFVGASMSNLGVLPCYASIPFLSYSGTDIGVWAVLIGIVFSIIRYQNLLPAEHMDKTRRYKYRLRIEKIAL